MSESSSQPASLPHVVTRLHLLIVLIVVVGTAWTWLSRPQGAMTGASAAAPRVGAPAPDFQMPALAGGTVRLSELKGKVVVLNFWATWCPPCRAEMPALEQAQSALGSKGLLVLGVNQMEDASVVASFMRSINLDFAIALDANGAVSRAYRVSALPTTFFIDRDGVIRDVVYGGPMTRALIESKVAPLLGQ